VKGTDTTEVVNIQDKIIGYSNFVKGRKKAWFWEFYQARPLKMVIILHPLRNRSTDNCYFCLGFGIAVGIEEGRTSLTVVGYLNLNY
jgi:hypothetical protein